MKNLLLTLAVLCVIAMTMMTVKNITYQHESIAYDQCWLCNGTFPADEIKYIRINELDGYRLACLACREKIDRLQAANISFVN